MLAKEVYPRLKELKSGRANDRWNGAMAVRCRRAIRRAWLLAGRPDRAGFRPVGTASCRPRGGHRRRSPDWLSRTRARRRSDGAAFRQPRHRPGRRVIFQLPNSLECVISYFACLKVSAIPVACLPAHRHTEIEHLGRFTEAYAWLIPSEYRRFDHVAMADELRESLPSMREIIVVGDRAAARMTLFSDLAADAIEERAAVPALDRLTPKGSDPRFSSFLVAVRDYPRSFRARTTTTSTTRACSPRARVSILTASRSWRFR